MGADDPFASEVLAPEVDADEHMSADAEDQSDQVVDKRDAVRELSDLFRQSEVDSSTPTFLVPDASKDQQQEEAEDAGEFPAEPENKHRVEDDEEITRGLISRLIDGVKGL